MSDPGPVRIATLGAARITPMSLLKPARELDDVEVVAVADWGRGRPATYTHQLRAFVGRVRGGPQGPTTARDGIANMRVVDAVYDKAGLPRRGQQ